MAKSLSPAKQSELDELLRSSLLILDALAANGLEARQVEQLRMIAMSAHAKKMLSGLRAFRADKDEWIRELPAPEQEKIRKALMSKGHDDLNVRRAKVLQTIQQVEARGRIVNDEEYALILARVEEIYADPLATDEVNTLNSLLSDYSRS